MQGAPKAMTPATARGVTPPLTRHVSFSVFVRGWTNDVEQAVASISLGRHSQRKSFSHACNSVEFVLPHYRGGAVTPNAGGRRWRSQKRVRVVLSYARALSVFSISSTCGSHILCCFQRSLFHLPLPPSPPAPPLGFAAHFPACVSLSLSVCVSVLMPPCLGCALASNT